MAQQRSLSPRPLAVVDFHHNLIEVGKPGPLGRERVIFALPFNTHGNDSIPGFQYPAPQTTVDFHHNFVAEPDATIVGRAGTWIPRLLVALWTEDTRRLAG